MAIFFLYKFTFVYMLNGVSSISVFSIFPYKKSIQIYIYILVTNPMPATYLLSKLCSQNANWRWADIIIRLINQKFIVLFHDGEITLNRIWSATS